jgi:anti-sigma-K factor RskA
MLTKQQKELLFDYCLGLTSENDTIKAKKLISSDKNAAEICSKLKAALTPLESLEPPLCPNYLVERTVALVNRHRKPPL